MTISPLHLSLPAFKDGTLPTAFQSDTQEPMSSAGKLTWTQPKLLRENGPRRDTIVLEPGRMVTTLRQRTEQGGYFLPRAGNKMCKENKASPGPPGLQPSAVRKLPRPSNSEFP